jgi:hypothetical protein
MIKQHNHRWWHQCVAPYHPPLLTSCILARWTIIILLRVLSCGDGISLLWSHLCGWEHDHIAISSAWAVPLSQMSRSILNSQLGKLTAREREESIAWPWSCLLINDHILGRIIINYGWYKLAMRGGWPRGKRGPRVQIYKRWRKCCHVTGHMKKEGSNRVTKTSSKFDTCWSPTVGFQILGWEELWMCDSEKRN